VCLFDLELGKLVWLTAYGGRRFRTVPKLRQIKQALGYHPRYYSKFNLIVHLFPEWDGRLSILGFQADNGTPKWRTLLPIPRPVWFTENRATQVDLQTEEMRVLLAQREDSVTMVLNRHSRLTESWTGEGEHFALPKWGARIDLIEFDPRHGHIVRKRVLKDAFVPFEEETRFVGLHVVRNRLYDMDWSQFRSKLLSRLKGEQHSINSHENRLIVVSKARKSTHVFLQNRTGAAEEIRYELPIRAKHRVHARSSNGAFTIQIDETRIVPLDSAGKPMGEVRVLPYIYSHVRSDDHTMFVHCSGHVNKLYCFDLRNMCEKFAVPVQALGLFQCKASGDVYVAEAGRLLRYTAGGRMLKSIRCNLSTLIGVGEGYMLAHVQKIIADGGYESAVYTLPRAGSQRLHQDSS
jgi:hypothetical protein